MSDHTRPSNDALRKALSTALLMAAADLNVIGEHHGYAGAGPLNLDQTDGDAAYVHITWPGGGMFVTPRQARAIARDLVALAAREEQRTCHA